MTVRHVVALGLWLLAAAVPARAGAQRGEGPRLEIRDPGPGRLAPLVRAALARPHLVIAGDSGRLVLRRDTTYRMSVVVLNRDVAVASAIQGDLVVLNGDVFLRPGARISGRIITTGGGIANSLLATVGGERDAFRDETLVATPRGEGAFALDYRVLRTRPSSMVSLPGAFGVRIPAYDRVNGLTLPVAPFISLDSGRVSLEPTLTYRSHLGALDPSVSATVSLGRRMRAEAFVGRGTWTNDRWIHTDLGNTFGAVFTGRDTRNWYRADRVEGAVHRLHESATASITPFVGASAERAWPTGIQAPPRHVAYSLFGRRDADEGMARPNPAITRGTMVSLLGGFEGAWQVPAQQLDVAATGRVEAAPSSPGGSGFGQLTLDGRATFPLTPTIEFRFDAHGVVSLGDTPLQRWVYLGGSGTLPTVDLLSRRGDLLLFTESRASMTLERIPLPLVGPPTVVLRHMMGAAGDGTLGGLTHNLAVRVSVMLLRAELAVDPVAGDRKLSVGVSFSR